LSLTFWGAVLVFVGGGLEAIGMTGWAELVVRLIAILGVSGVGFGIRKALK